LPSGDAPSITQSVVQPYALTPLGNSSLWNRRRTTCATNQAVRVDCSGQFGRTDREPAAPAGCGRSFLTASCGALDLVSLWESYLTRIRGMPRGGEYNVLGHILFSGNCWVHRGRTGLPFEGKTYRPVRRSGPCRAPCSIGLPFGGAARRGRCCGHKRPGSDGG